jgi:hypothetical protein
MTIHGDGAIAHNDAAGPAVSLREDHGLVPGHQRIAGIDIAAHVYFTRLRRSAAKGKCQYQNRSLHGLSR